MSSFDHGASRSKSKLITGIPEKEVDSMPEKYASKIGKKYYFSRKGVRHLNIDMYERDTGNLFNILKSRDDIDGLSCKIDDKSNLSCLLKGVIGVRVPDQGGLGFWKGIDETKLRWTAKEGTIRKKDVPKSAELPSQLIQITSLQIDDAVSSGLRAQDEMEKLEARLEGKFDNDDNKILAKLHTCSFKIHFDRVFESVDCKPM